MSYNILQYHDIEILVSMTHIFDSSYFLFKSHPNTPYREFFQQGVAYETTSVDFTGRELS